LADKQQFLCPLYRPRCIELEAEGVRRIKLSERVETGLHGRGKSLPPADRRPADPARKRPKTA
jgi:hypothetical protein